MIPARARAPMWSIAALVFVATAGWLVLVEPTESRYAEIAREMAASGDWLVPRLDGLPHFHKPPLSYWGAALGIRIAGRNPWGARALAAAAAAFALWATARAARGRACSEAESSLGRDAGQASVALAPLLLGSSLLFFALGHQLASDIFLTAASTGYLAAMLDARARAGWAPYLALAVGFLAKGPVVLVLTVVPALVAALWARRSDVARRLAWGRGWLVFAALALPWFVIVVARTPGLLGHFLDYQLWQRYATTVHERPGPPYYFIPVLLAGMLPWTAPALLGIWRAARRSRHDFESALLVAWVLVPLAFFSGSGSKLPAYVLPLCPAFAVLAGEALARPRFGVTLATALSLAALAAALELLVPRALAHAALAERARCPGFAPPPLPFLAIHLAAAAFLFSAVCVLRRRSLASALAALLALVVLLWGARPTAEALLSPNRVARTLRAERRPGEPVIECRDFDATLPFSLGETVGLLEVEREIGFGDSAARAARLVTASELPALARRHGGIWLYGPRGIVEQALLPLSLPAQVRACWRGRVLVRAGLPATPTP